MTNAYAQAKIDSETLKKAVKEHWESEPCESRAGYSSNRKDFFEEIDRYRYEKSPFIPGFAKFEEGKNKRVLEIGLGSGSDFIRWVRAGAKVWGVDLTDASIALVRERLQMEALSADFRRGDVESLTFENDYFDIVYSYGVIHHTPDTRKALDEIHRVLQPGGVTRIMIYHLGGITWFYQWILFGLLKGRPWRSRRDIAFHYNESLGTKLYSRDEARNLFGKFRQVTIRTIVDCGDTLDFQLSERYRKVWVIRMGQKCFGFLKYFRNILPSSWGTTMLIEAVK